MEIESTPREAGLRIPALACTIPYLVGMLLIYVGERLVGSPQGVRLLLDGFGLAAILWAVIGRLVNRAGSSGERRSVEGRVLAAYLAGILALALYALQLDPVRSALLPFLEAGKGLDRFEGILEVLWPIVWISAVLPLVFMEISYASMARAPRIERWRVAFSARSGLTIAWLCATLFLVNYIANVHNRKWDLTYLRVSSPSEQAREMVSNLTEPLDVVLFFPDVNEVREEVLSYLSELEPLSDLLRVSAYDQVLEPKKAEELGARQNGTLAFRYGDKKETLRLGLDLDEARSKLNKLDEEFQKKFLTLVAAKKIAYFTTGHGERPYDWTTDKDARAPVKDLKSILRKQNFEVKPLGVGQGLGSEVPEDASLVLIIDPTEDFLPEELDALHRYLDRGGRMWVALDPESRSNIADLVASYGVRFVGVPLANDRYYLRAHYNKADRYNVFTNRTSSHSSVNTLSRNASRMAVVLPGTGYLEKVDGAPGKVVMTLRSMSMTWADENRNLEHDGPEEEKKTYDLAAAVTAPVTASAEGEAETVPAGQKGKDEMRMIVLADADALSDKAIGNLGNYYLFADGLKWLIGEEAVLGSVTTEEDVRITHTKQEDVAWFYLTIFAVPAFLLVIGIIYNQLRLRRRRGKGA